MNILRNKLVMIGGGLSAAILLAELILLLLANGKLGRSRLLLEKRQCRLEQLHRRKPFPSENNVEQLQGELDRFEYMAGELAAVMVRDPFPQDAVEAADFSARAQDVIERLRKRATQAGIILPDALEAGFAQYASGGAIPLAKHVPRLSRQLYSVERVADMLVRGGVGSIDALTRDEFETRPATAHEATRRRRPRRGALADRLQKPETAVASVVHPIGLYFIERVGVSFSAKEDVVWRVLDLFASAPHFMVVKEFAHATESNILSYNPEAVKRGGKGEDETLNYLSGGILVGEQALSRPERIVAGGEIVQVRLVVDVYNFEPGGDAQ